LLLLGWKENKTVERETSVMKFKDWQRTGRYKERRHANLLDSRWHIEERRIYVSKHLE